MDFSTLELRRRACVREVEVNRPNAPELYLGVVPITRAADGRLAIAGEGEIVEWAVHMRAFSQRDLLSAHAERGDFSPELAKALADAVFASHARAYPADGADGWAKMAAIADEIGQGLARHDALFPAAEREAFRARLEAKLVQARDCLTRRAERGCVRRCHGDLHLDNVVIWNGSPVLFDAIEFDDDLATIDTLYDLAFLLMDLEHRGRRSSANTVLNRYLWRSGSDLDIEGLAAMPLFLGLRAGIRAMVMADKSQFALSSTGAGPRQNARSYLRAALDFLEPPAPRLVAIGGVSGTGKSTLAAALAPTLGAAPGALHLRSDLERKAMFAAGETDRLGPECYTEDVTERVYADIARKARLALAAGHAVVADAVYLNAEQRSAIEAAALGRQVPFQGLWLTAPKDILAGRVSTRSGDASDATPAVLEQQLSRGPGTVGWSVVDASREPSAIEAAARRILKLPLAHE
jgi:aminoglycoside phosphotransferase family enzyme/predicted kinase